MSVGVTVHVVRSSRMGSERRRVMGAASSGSTSRTIPLTSVIAGSRVTTGRVKRTDAGDPPANNVSQG